MEKLMYSAKQFVKYFSVGIIGFIAEFMLFNLMLWILPKGLWLVMGLSVRTSSVAHSLSVVAGAIICFVLNKIWSFKHEPDATVSKSTAGQILRYGILFTGNLFLSNFLLIVMTPYLGLQLAKVGIMAVLVPWNFVMYKFFVYKS